MSSFGAKRKARIIQTLDDDEDDQKPSVGSGEEQHDRKSQSRPGLASPCFVALRC